jgi:hypothetical protein
MKQIEQMKKYTQIKYIILFIILIIICLFLYLYVKSEKFSDTTVVSSPTPTPTTGLISIQLTEEIARVLNISPRRITNLKFTGDISKSQLNISFIILEANLTELSNKEMKAVDATNVSDERFNSGNFIIIINNKSILLNKIQSTVTPTNTINYFDNKALITIANYATNKYISVPNTASLTNFYKLSIDNNYNIKPKINTTP